MKDVSDFHIPVLAKEVLKIFNPQPGEKYIDATINGGGHAKKILEKVMPNGIVVGIDWDGELIKILGEKTPEAQKNNLILICDNYANIKSIVAKYNLGQINGIIFDLGFSSYHLEKSERGFSFLKNEPLDMRYNIYENDLTAEKIINQWDEKAIEIILRDFGEERFARNIARRIVAERKTHRITTTGELVEIILRSIPGARIKTKIHPATRTFQALRIAVNDELGNIKRALRDSVDILSSGAKIAVISFHSIEDRIVKNFFQETEKTGILRRLTKKPVRAADEEIQDNPRARSARLRAVERI